MVEHLLHEGLIQGKDGQWRIGQDITTTDIGIPDSLRQLIDKQFERLGPEEQRILTAGSIVGREFAVAVVAAILAQDSEDVEKRCAGLAMKSQFVRTTGLEEWPDGTISGRYSFSHALYQKAVYERTATARRIGLHRRIGECKEAAYGQRAGEIAGELAIHFEQGHDYQQAIRYLEQAGKTASRRHAHQEAIRHFTKGLELLQALPDTPERSRHELTLQLTLVGPLLTSKGYTALEVEKTYVRARELCRQLGDPPQPFSAVLFGLCIFYQLRGDVQKGHDLAKQLLALAQSVQNPTLLLRAHMALGNVLYFLGDFAASREHLQQGFTFYLPHKHNPLVSNIAQDLGVICSSRAALDLWFLGYPDQARRSSDAGLTLAQELSHPFSLAFALHAAAGVQHECRETQTAQREIERLLTLSEEQGFPYYAAWGTIWQGWMQVVMQDEGEDSVARMLHGLAALRIAGSELGLSYFVALLAEAYGKIGQTEEGLAVLTETLDTVQKTGERFYEAELYRLKGQLTLQKFQVSSLKSQVTNLQPPAPSTSAEAEAEACFHKALEIARRQQAKSLELRAATSLARLWQTQGKSTEARQLLEEVYSRFTEGFATKDLRDAEVLLTTLGGKIENKIENKIEKRRHGTRQAGQSRSQGDSVPPSLFVVQCSAEAPLTSNPQPQAVGIFRHEGAYWTLAFQGVVCRIKDIRGLHYLAPLLQNPDKEFHALALETGSSPPQGSTPPRLSMAESSAERARINVTRAIKTAIKKIAASHLPLGQHLHLTIKTGMFCSYMPGSRQSSSWQE
jgi:predicted ATPase